MAIRKPPAFQLPGSLKQLSAWIFRKQATYPSTVVWALQEMNNKRVLAGKLQLCDETLHHSANAHQS